MNPENGHEKEHEHLIAAHNVPKSVSKSVLNMEINAYKYLLKDVSVEQLQNCENTASGPVFATPP